MSIYPKFNSNTNTFNSSNIISQEEVGNGSNVVTLDLSNFVQRTAPVFDEELYLDMDFSKLIIFLKSLMKYRDSIKTKRLLNKISSEYGSLFFVLSSIN